MNKSQEGEIRLSAVTKL